MLVALLTLVAACSETALSGLGERSSGWIEEVATTTTSPPTTVASPTRPATEANWVNDEFGSPPPDSRSEEVVTQVVGRSTAASRFLQASRAEIALAVPLVEFPSLIPAEAEYITSQIVVDAGTLRLSANPTVAFGLWSVEPYTRSRSVGQVAVITVFTDSAGAAAAADVDSVCAAIVDRLCRVESLPSGPVWRLETSTEVTRLWFSGPYRYEMAARPDQEDAVLGVVISSMVPLVELVPSPGALSASP